MLDCSCKNNDYTVAPKKQQNVQPDRVPDRDMGAVHCSAERNKEVISTRCSSGGYSEVLLIFGGPTDIRRLYAYSLPDICYRRHRRRRCKTFLPRVNLYRLNTKMHISHLRAIFRYFVGVFPMLLDFQFYGIDLWMV